MNHFCVLSVGILLLLAQTGFAQTAETEPNNTFTQANPITLGTSLSIRINPDRDVDYYKITLDRPGVIEVAAESLPADLGVRLRAFNSATEEVGVVNTPGKGKNTYLSAYACGAGVYYIKVEDAYISQDGSPTAFNLTVTLNTSDAFECNNSFITATEVKSGQAFKAAIHPDGDVDYFKLTVDKPGVIDVLAENLSAELGVRLRVYNSANQEIATANTPGKGKNAYLSASACNAGVYYIKVEDAYIAQDGSPTVFDVKITLNNTDAFECNNSFLTAKEISSGQATKIAIHPGNDEDYVKININKPGVINISAENLPQELGVRLQVFNAANQQIAAIGTPGKGTNAYLNTQVCALGAYYIKIEDAYISQDGSPTLFDFKVVHDTTDAYECNNSFVAAKDIQVDKPIKAAINADDDLDYFKFTLAARTTLNLTVNDVPAAVAMQMIVYNASQSAIQNTSSGNRGVALAIRKYALDAGTYYVRLSGSDYASQLYTFSVARDTLLPPKLVANVLSVCPGGEVRLTASECTGTVRWSTNQTGLTITARPTAVTAYTAVCEDGGRTSVPSAPLTISLKLVPTAMASAGNNGQYYETQTIELLSSGGGTYGWRGPNNYVSTAQNPTIVNAKVGMSGSYAVTVTNTDGCTATASTNVTIALITTLEPDPVGIRMDVSPNPASDVCTVKLLLETAASAQLDLLDTEGRSIRQWSSGRVSRSHEAKLSLADLSPGTYLIRAVVNDRRAVRKLLKQ